MSFKTADEDDEELLTVHIGSSGSLWPAAEEAGLVNAGGLWMTPGALEKMRAWKRRPHQEGEPNGLRGAQSREREEGGS